MKRTIGFVAVTSFFLALGSACGQSSHDDARAVDGERAAIGEAKGAIKRDDKKVLGAAHGGPLAAEVAKKAAPIAAEAAKQPACDEAPKGDCGCNGDEEEAARTQAAEAARTPEDVRLGDAPVRGAARAPVTIVVFSDFECPFCAKAEDTMRELTQKYGSRVRIAWKNRPLPFHQHATLAARAALAAGEQGKFWEYHDAIFAHQRELDRASLERRAQDLGLDLTRFRAALDSERIAAAVEADNAQATKLDVAGTPTFFVNGKRIIGAQPLAKFEAAVDEALAAR